MRRGNCSASKNSQTVDRGTLLQARAFLEIRIFFFQVERRPVKENTVHRKNITFQLCHRTPSPTRQRRTAKNVSLGIPQTCKISKRAWNPSAREE